MILDKSITTDFSQVVDDIKQIIDTGRNAAYAAVDATMIATYWNIGRRIVEEEQHGQERAQYGKELIKTLAKELTHEYGSGNFANTFAKSEMVAYTRHVACGG